MYTNKNAKQRMNAIRNETMNKTKKKRNWLVLNMYIELMMVDYVSHEELKFVI